MRDSVKISTAAFANIGRRIRLPLVAALLFSLCSPTPSFAFDFAQWDAILKTHTRESHWQGVAYTGLDYADLAGSKQFDKLIAGLESFSPQALRGRDEALSFWINVYNIFAVKIARDNFPIKGIKDAGGIITPVWKIPAGKIGGATYTLHGIEHEILRPMNEPAIHFAIVCASVSCPDLMAQAYTPSALKAQLKSQVSRFLENSAKGMRVEHADRTVYLSPIFDWYEKDFDNAGGVTGFLNSDMGGRRKIPAGYSVKYMPYNWGLNVAR